MTKSQTEGNGIKEKEYPITFTSDYIKYEEWGETNDFWKNEVKNNPNDYNICKKYNGKKISLSKLPEFVEEVGSIVFDGETIEVYNDYRE